MNQALRILTGVLILLFANIAAACDYPVAVSIPKGQSATPDEMLASQRGVTGYVVQMSAYLQCIGVDEKQSKKAAGSLTPKEETDRKDKQDKEYRKAVKDMEKTLQEFNAEADKFRKRASK